MSREFPDIVDPWKVAEGKRTFQGTMPLVRLQRLAELLAPVEGSGEASPARDAVPFEARFGIDRQGLVVIDIRVSASLPLVCQRSLEVFQLPVERRSKLVVIEDIANQESVPDIYEPILVEDRRLAMADLVEEELLLAIPQVPRRPGAENEERVSKGVAESTDLEAEEEPTHRPFQGLAGLMRKTSGT
ncbi:MAG: DNA-binding protein [Xanthomonadales bacterium]|nr:DUF177 domain-containing protein [Gammaproteobacteria bacterium]NNL05619.1 DNA-binding protein [Xanthomonadales bacterium]